MINHFKDNKNKSPLNTRWAQMTKQEQIIERKKMEIQAKLEAQKQAADLAAQAKLANPATKDEKNIFSNDGSFMNQFKALLEKQKKEKELKELLNKPKEEKRDREESDKNESSDYDDTSGDGRTQRDNEHWNERSRNSNQSSSNEDSNKNQDIPSLMQIPVRPPNADNSPNWQQGSNEVRQNQMPPGPMPPMPPNMMGPGMMGPGPPNMGPGPMMGPGGPNMPFMGGPPNFPMPPNFMGPNGPRPPCGPMPPNMCGPNGPMPPFFGPPFPNPGMMGPNGPPNSSGPNGPPNSMMGPNGPMMGPNGPMMGPNGPMMGPNGPMMGPNGPMMGPNGPPNHMMGPNGPPNPMMGPNGPMMGPNGPMMGPNGPSNHMMGPPNQNGPPGNMMKDGPPNNMMGPNGPPNFMMGPNGPNPMMGGPNRPPNSMSNSMPFMGPRPPFGPNGPNFGNGPPLPPFMQNSPEDKDNNSTSEDNQPPMPSNNPEEDSSQDSVPASVRSAADDVATKGDHWENVLKNSQDPNMWFLHETRSKEYKTFRGLVEKLRKEKKPEVKDEDKYEPEFSLEDDDSYDGKPVKDENCNSNESSSYNFWQTKREHASSQSDEEQEIKKERRKRKKSRWGDDPPVTDIKPPGVMAALPPAPGTVPPGMMPSFGTMPPLPGMPPMPPIPGTTGPKLAKIDSEDGLKLTNVNRNNQALMQYAITNYGTTNLSPEDWKKCEDNFKLNLLYQDMLKKRNEVERLAAAGKHKYEYDSDEDTSEGTWEHRLRAREMNATEKWADELTKQAAGKHHIGDFLPPEELKKFMEKYSAVKSGKEPDLSDYKEFKLKEDNVGFKMLQKLGWSEGKGLGAEGSGIVEPINKANQPVANLGLGANMSDNVAPEDDEFDAYRKRMMLAYRFRPNPLNNPRRPYY